MARIHHPDKVDGSEKIIANEKFHLIHQAFLVLSDVDQRNRYDNGFDVLFAKPTITAEWEQCLRPVTNEEMHSARNKYQNSNEEQEDIEREYLAGKGSMTHMLNNLPFMRIGDEARVIEIIKELVIEKHLPKFKIKKIARK